jgi:hypothetical protein
MYFNRRRVRARIWDYSVMHDAMAETYDLCVSVLSASSSQLCLSHIVVVNVEEVDVLDAG